jgi:Uma2 family endonuclease
MSSIALVEVEYPESDGKPMAESDLHRNWMFRIIELLAQFFLGQRVYISGNLLIYYEEGNPRRSVAPDAFVVKDCEPGERRVFKIWEEGRTPCFVLETTSSSTRHEDQGHKMGLYAALGVAEYLLYDPLGEWLDPALFGYRLVGGGYVPMEGDGQNGLVSRQLGITFRLEDGQLALFETATGMRLLTAREQLAAAEARIRQLEEQLARLTSEPKP